MEYPTRLLPQPNYKHILFEEKHQNCFILRHTDSQDIKDEFGYLRSECLVAQTDHLKDYSTNLLPYFTLNDVKIRLLKSEDFDYFTQLWHYNNLNKTPQYHIDFDVVENRSLFFFRVGDIHQVIFNGFDDSLPAKPMCRIIHTPINANFWHCSVRWFFNDKNLSDTEMTKGQKKRILSLAKAFLIERACFDLPEHDAIQNIDFEKAL
jgi:hypothetical protein